MPWAGLRRCRRAAAAFATAAALGGSAARAEMPVDSACFVTGDGVRLCYATDLTADATLPLLVFIPGWTMPAAVWEKQLAFFAGKYPLLAFDPRGQGASAAPGFGYALERRAQDIAELLDRFPGRQAVLIGWSLAVLEALAYVSQRGDERLAGLVLVDNGIGEGPEPPRTAENPFFEALRTRREEALRDFAAAIFRTPTDEALREKIHASALKLDVEDSIALFPRDLPRSYWRAAVYRCAKPVLYLVTPRWREQAQALARHHPRATTRVFEEAGHALFWDEAERFNQELLAFLTGLRGDAVR